MLAEDWRTSGTNLRGRFVKRPYYKTNAQQLEALFEATKTHKLGLLFQMVAFYGMRRGEAPGLRWDAIDFERNVFTIRHTVTECKIDGRQTLVQQGRAKNRSSRRTMPLAPGFKTQLMALILPECTLPRPWE